MKPESSLDIVETTLGPTPWVVVRGARRQAFSALGARYAAAIQAVLAGIPDLPRMRTRVGTADGPDRFAAVRDASRERHPEAWTELEALADGAEAEFEDLLMLNLRGDLGLPTQAGCSDLAWTDGSNTFIAHNEDDFPVVGPHCLLLTLILEGEPALTTWWSPGFLPGNTWTSTENGLFFALDHLNIAYTADAPGRQFVARDLLRASDIEEAVDWLRKYPSAGGFAYNIGQLGQARIVAVETGAGRFAMSPNTGAGELHWHANHVRYLPPHVDRPLDESLARGQCMAGLTPPDSPDTSWFLSVLRSPRPAGLYRTAAGQDELATQCSVVVDLMAGELTLVSGTGLPFTVPMRSLASTQVEVNPTSRATSNRGLETGGAIASGR